MTNKMSKILDGIVKMIADRIVPYRQECRNIYFKSYVNSVVHKRDMFIVYIDSNSNLIESTFVAESINLACQHICIDHDYTKEDIENYVIYLLTCHINDQFYNNYYQQYNYAIRIDSKTTPETFRGMIKLNDDDDPITILLKPKNTELNYINHVTGVLSKFISNKYPMPFCIETDVFIVIEECSPLSRYDPFIEVIKDVSNQLKCMKDYRFAYLNISDIGRSSYGLKRYFIFNFDAIVPTNGKHRDQLINLISLLCMFFTHKTEPTSEFKQYMEFLELQPDNSDIYEQFLVYLLNKNE